MSLHWSDSYLSITLYVVTAVLGVVYGVVRRFVRSRISENWVQVQGRVGSSQVRIASQGGEGTVYAAEIAYSYTVEGEFYGGVATAAFSSESAADSFVHMYPAGTAVTLRCHPRHAEKSMLREDDNGSLISAAGHV